MVAEIITIGDEILIGQVIDSNSAFIGRELTKIGIDVHKIKTIKDSPGDILAALKEAEQRADVILITGGLGPTKDDKTKATFCRYFEDELVENQAALNHIKTLFNKIDEPILSANIEQAKLPSKALALPNKYGTAPGMWFEQDGVVYVAMPGVPYEMKALMTDEVLPRLVKKFDRPFILHKTVLTYGMGESQIAYKIQDWEEALPMNMELAYLPSPGRVRLRLTARGTDKAFLQTELEAQLKRLHTLIGDVISGYEGEDSLQARIAEKLTALGKTLALAESCTGGNIATLFTQMPGASAYFKGSIVPYATNAKTAVLGVPQAVIAKHSVVSAEVAKAMAKQAQKIYQSDFALATTGNAGPTKGDSKADIGTVFIALAFDEQVVVKEFHFNPPREKVVRKTVYKALDMLKNHLF